MSTAQRDEVRTQLLTRLSTWIEGYALPRTRLWDAESSAAERAQIGLAVARFQAAHNRPYRRYLDQIGSSPPAWKTLADVPPLPTDAFKRADLTCFPPDRAVATFRSSGTTQSDRGRHHFRTLALTRAAELASFRTWFTPDRDTLRVLLLMAPAADEPTSSLGHMLQLVRDHWGDDQSEHLVEIEAGEGRLRIERARQALAQASNDRTPVLLAGPSFAYVHLLDGLAGETFDLPAGSRLLETGGFKGKSRRVDRMELHGELRKAFSLDPSMICGEYGMSELSSQLYEPQIRAQVLGFEEPRRVYIAPPWVEVRVIDGVTLADVAPGEIGHVALFDPMNLDSVSSLVTGDLGRLVGGADLPPDGALELLGRAPGAAPKGCSLALDQLLDQSP